MMEEKMCSVQWMLQETLSRTRLPFFISSNFDLFVGPELKKLKDSPLKLKEYIKEILGLAIKASKAKILGCFLRNFNRHYENDFDFFGNIIHELIGEALDLLSELPRHEIFDATEVVFELFEPVQGFLEYWEPLQDPVTKKKSG